VSPPLGLSRSRDILLQVKPMNPNPDRLVFGTRTGRPMGASNVRRRILAPAQERANAKLVKQGLNPIDHLTPHSLRRTYASMLYAIGETPPIVMQEMGHMSPRWPWRSTPRRCAGTRARTPR
jgi:integrase